MKRLLIIGAVAVAALAGLAFTSASTSSSGGRSVTTTGHGVVTVVPDEATVTAGVRTSARTASAALAANSAAMAKVIGALKQVGFKSIQTQEVSVYPQTGPNGNRVTGYVAQNAVSVVGAIADAGRLIDAAVGAGANTIDGPVLGVSIQNRLYRQALRQAVADAKAKAASLGAAGGFRVGRVLTVSEESTPQPITFGASAGAAKTATPVEPGTQTVTADVQVTFAIG
jgi:uncharacterized protein YggE